VFREDARTGESRTLRASLLVVGLAIVLTAAVLGFLIIRTKQDRDARAARQQIEKARLAEPNNNPTGDPKAATAPSPERGAYGIPRNIIGPTGAEAQIISVLKMIRNAEAVFMVETTKTYGTFDELVAHHYLNSTFAGSHPIISEYSLTLSIQGSFDSKGSPPSFKVNADPIPGTTRRHYYISDNSPIRYSLTGPATDKDSFEDYQ
jgi:hypothetical protein